MYRIRQTAALIDDRHPVITVMNDNTMLEECKTFYHSLLVRQLTGINRQACMVVWSVDRRWMKPNGSLCVRKGSLLLRRIV